VLSVTKRLYGLFMLVLSIGLIGAGITGVLSLTRATSGVGLIAGACLCGIVIRLLQASLHQRELKSMMDEENPEI
jgi:hypothetical protein